MRRSLISLLFGAVLAAALPIAAASAAGASLPAVSGGFGQVPTIKFPSGKPPSSLTSKMLHQGHGSVVHKGNLLVANYVGQIWGGKVFDSSFARKVPAGFAIGVGQVIPGWDKVLVGKRVGSRLLLVAPPADGYGKAGLAQAGIKGTDTLVFVVDVLATYNKSAAADPKATHLATGVKGISVTGKLGGTPKVSITKGTQPPTAVVSKVLARGHGPKLSTGLMVFQAVIVDWTGKVAQSSWQQGIPQSDVIGEKSTPSVLDSLLGVPVGSRVLLELPKNSQGGPYVAVVDVVAEPSSTHK